MKYVQKENTLFYLLFNGSVFSTRNIKVLLKINKKLNLRNSLTNKFRLSAATLKLTVTKLHREFCRPTFGGELIYCKKQKFSLKISLFDVNKSVVIGTERYLWDAI